MENVTGSGNDVLGRGEDDCGAGCEDEEELHFGSLVVAGV